MTSDIRPILAIVAVVAILVVLAVVALRPWTTERPMCNREWNFRHLENPWPL
jgi:hypothetical protein